MEETSLGEDANLPLEVGLFSDEAPPDAEEFGLLLTFGTQVPVGDKKAYRINMAIEGKFHVLDSAQPLNADTVSQFKSRDAIILLWPYLRQMLHDLVTRMRIGIEPLPVLDARTLVQESMELQEPDP